MKRKSQTAVQHKRLREKSGILSGKENKVAGHILLHGGGGGGCMWEKDGVKKGDWRDAVERRRCVSWW